MKGYLLIDGSYFVFYRFYALMQWWKCRNKGEKLECPIENEEFVNKFKSTFIDKIKYLYDPVFDYDWGKMDVKVIVAKDCARKSIWRMKLLNSYKGTRTTEDDFIGGPFFKMAYDELFEQAGVKHIINYDTLEADDCIAILTKELLKDPDNRVKIITSDTDYLQLYNDCNCKLIDKKNGIHNLKIYNLKNKNNLVNVDKFINRYCEIYDSKASWKMKTYYALLYKIIHGDKSDNIPQIIKPLSQNKFNKLYNLHIRETMIENYLKDKDSRFKNENAWEDFKLNTKLINFNCIPKDLRAGFLEKYEHLCVSNNSGSYIHSN